jgi:hypothetical protein
VPLAWHPRLLHTSPKERNRWRLIGRGKGTHWPDLDEDISVENLLFGNPSDRANHFLALGMGGWNRVQHSRSVVAGYVLGEVSLVCLPGDIRPLVSDRRSVLAKLAMQKAASNEYLKP